MSLEALGTAAAFDIGGTFTDIVVSLADGRLKTYKILSIQQVLGKTVADCMAQATGGGRLDALIHGTTVGTNAILEGKGARAALLTTRGFRDLLEMRRFSIAGSRDFNWERSPALIPRRCRAEVPERMAADGSVVVHLDREAVQEALRKLKEQKIESLAVCFINSYVNPAHEIAVREIAAEVLPGMPISLSHEVLPAYREYERTSTTSVNAYLQPVAAAYFDSLEAELGRFGTPILVMQSNGGVTTSLGARAKPVATVESGPAAGVLAASVLAREAGIPRAVALDMGGTTVKASLIENGRAAEKNELEVGGYANSSARWFRGKGYCVALPSFDIVEAGAGGGSIAWVDKNGTLRVGPESAGASPGPVCYGRGGEYPTITDANVVLGFLNPKAIAGGKVRIDSDAARRSLESGLCAQLGIPLLDAAFAVYQIANAAMMRTVRAVTTERGRDPKDYALIAFGGAGPVHAASLAEMLGISRVYFPMYPGLFSALGLLLADARHDFVQSMLCKLESLDLAALGKTQGALVMRAGEQLGPSAVQSDRTTLHWSADLRYSRQTHEMRVAIPDCPPDQVISSLSQRFHEQHEQHFGYRAEDPIMLINISLKLITSSKGMRFSTLGESLRESMPFHEPVQSKRSVYFGHKGGLHTATVIQRAQLASQSLCGPLIIEEPDTTMVVPPGWEARLDALGSVVLERTT